jgi:hypothetical protein
MEARARALDPAVLDASARTALADAEFHRDRLVAALPELRDRLTRLQSNEAYDLWLVDYEKVKVERDGAVDELRALYPDFVDKLTNLLARIECIDADVRRVTYAKPEGRDGDGRWLRSVELEARGINGFGLHDHSLLRDLRLPTWEPGGAMAWPPHRPLIIATPPMPCPPLTPEQIAASKAARREESERVAAHYQQQARGRWEREKKEACEELERQIAERNRRHGWG